MEPSRFASLPEELFDPIISHLSTADRIALLRVSRKFRRIVEPTAYENVVLDNKRMKGKFKRFLKGNPALAKRVTALTVDATLENMAKERNPALTPPNLWMTSEICHGLQYLDSLQELRLRMPNLKETWDHNLAREVRAENVILWVQHEMKLEDAFSQATRVFERPTERTLLPNLTSLSLYTQIVGRMRTQLKHLTIFFIPTLRSLEIANYNIDQRIYVYSLEGHKRSTALEHLRFDNCRLIDEHISLILECPRALKTLALTMSEPVLDHHDLFGWSPVRLAEDLKPHQKSLESFEMFVGTTDGYGGQFGRILDLSQMEALRNVTCVRQSPANRIFRGVGAKITNMAAEKSKGKGIVETPPLIPDPLVKFSLRLLPETIMRVVSINNTGWSFEDGSEAYVRNILNAAYQGVWSALVSFTSGQEKLPIAVYEKVDAV